MANSSILPSRAYEEAFINASPPRSAHSTLQSRIQLASKQNEQMADIFRERAAIETQYIASLQKFQTKRGGGGGINRDGLGGFAGVWEKVWGEVQETMVTHTKIERVMRDEVETALRAMSSRGPWAKQSTFDSNIDKTLKYLESCQARLTKAQKKAESSRKEKTMAELADAQSSLADAQQGWFIEAPQVLALYQEIDESRLERLKEIFAKWQTTQGDISRENLESCERRLNGIFGWDIASDLQEFLLKKGMGSGDIVGGSRMDVERARQVSGVSVASRAQTVRRQSSAASYSQFTQNTNGANNEFGENGSIHSNGGTGAGGLGSTLKPLKSVFGRKNRASSLAGSPSTNQRARSGSVTGSGHGEQGGNGFSTLSDAGGEEDDVSPLPTRSGSNFVTTGSKDATNNNGSSNVPATGLGISSPSTTVDAEGFSIPPPDHNKKPWEMGTQLEDDHELSSAISSDSGPLKMAIAPTPIKETEEERQAALFAMKTALQSPAMAPPPQRRGTIARGRRDVRNTTFGMVPDDVPLAQALGQISRINTNVGGSGTTPSPSQVTNSGGLEGSSVASPFFTSPPAMSPFPSSTGSGDGSPATAPTTSIALGSSNPFAAGQASGLSSGFRASISETCNVVSRSGSVIKAMVTGQVACTFAGISTDEIASNGSTILLRLDQFEQLEKVAPNPQFIRSLGPNQPGEYSADVNALVQASKTSPGRPIVLFKYQLHIAEGKAERVVPLSIVPQWKCEDSETKLLINYNLNSNSTMFAGLASEPSPFDEPSTTTIDQVSFTVPINSSSVSNLQSKPLQASWHPELNQVIVPGEEVSVSQPSNKVVARMGVDNKSSVQPIQVKWIARGSLCSTLSVSVMNGQTGWKLDEVEKIVQSGKFLVD
ncbi:Predicted proline-serine-threonine phosphatase-interacting protein (PSTPIP) [Phaffia rhodozyma]|uniref:Predicted proline-serine-threonine phosphatase-interacting protein (PSTPIP) n=1 Tax=Phaffia rhodozyma TaxID=264483 RepID=A0A0F7SXV0_PHARH|nr:Predicted proline-serine-threonine phosphatase-interacting protein (PSTPIP) [Phaffia rhodozyma]